MSPAKVRSRGVIFVGRVGETLVIIEREASCGDALQSCWEQSPFPALPPGRYTVKRFLMTDSLEYLGEVCLETGGGASSGIAG